MKEVVIIRIIQKNASVPKDTRMDHIIMRTVDDDDNAVEGRVHGMRGQVECIK